MLQLLGRGCCGSREMLRSLKTISSLLISLGWMNFLASSWNKSHGHYKYIFLSVHI